MIQPASLHESESSSASQDAFGSKATKLCALFGLDEGARVLLIGDGAPDWKDDLDTFFSHLDCASTSESVTAVLAADKTYDLIVWTPGLDGSAFSPWVRPLRRVLTPSGSAFILAENRFAVRYWKRDTSRMLSPLRNAVSTYTRKLDRAGFERIRCFLPVPGLATAEQFVSLKSGGIDLSIDASLLERAANKSGLLWTIHDGVAYVVSGPQGGELGLVKEIEQQLRDAGHRFSKPLQLERFDLRDRGSLILFIRSGTVRLVCRIAIGQSVDLVIRRNDEWIRRIHENPQISDTIKAAVPRSLGTFDLKSGRAYVETLTPGVISWKLSQSVELERKLFAELASFITRLGFDTHTKTRLESSFVDGLLSFATTRAIDPYVAHECERLCERLRSRVTGIERNLAWNHGDFGYGNVIVSNTAVLTGVIDWDQARQGIAGVDLVNFLVQRERSVKGKSLVDALEEVGNSIRHGGFSEFDARLRYDPIAGTSREEREELMAWATLRFAQRSMSYPALFAAEREQTRLSLQWACDFLDHASTRATDAP